MSNLIGLTLLAAVAATDLPLERIQLPAGFVLEVYAEVKEARFLALSPKGTVFVGSQDEGRYSPSSTPIPIARPTAFAFSRRAFSFRTALLSATAPFMSPR